MRMKYIESNNPTQRRDLWHYESCDNAPCLVPPSAGVCVLFPLPWAWAGVSFPLLFLFSWSELILDGFMVSLYYSLNNLGLLVFIFVL